jgi:hypothetical protein
MGDGGDGIRREDSERLDFRQALVDRNPGRDGPADPQAFGPAPERAECGFRPWIPARKCVVARTPVLEPAPATLIGCPAAEMPGAANTFLSRWPRILIGS